MPAAVCDGDDDDVADDDDDMRVDKSETADSSMLPLPPSDALTLKPDEDVALDSVETTEELLATDALAAAAAGFTAGSTGVACCRGCAIVLATTVAGAPTLRKAFVEIDIEPSSSSPSSLSAPRERSMAPADACGGVAPLTPAVAADAPACMPTPDRGVCSAASCGSPMLRTNTPLALS